MTAVIDAARGLTRVRVVAALAVLVAAGGAVALAGGTAAPHPRATRPVPATFPPLPTPSVTDGAARSVAAPPSLGTAGPVDAVTGGAAAAATVGGTPSSSGLVPAPGTRVVRQASVTLQTARHHSGDAFDRVTAVAVDRGGYVASSTRTRGETPGGVVELRVPADKFDDARRALSGIATVTSEEVHGQDVGDQLVDLEARIKSLQAEEETLRALVGQAKTVGEVLQVQPQLFDVRRQIEQLQAQHQNLDQASSFATISVTITEKGAGSPIRPPRPEPVLSRSVATAWHAAASVVGGMVIVLGATTPLALVGLLAWTVWRLRRRPVRVVPAAAPPA